MFHLSLHLKEELFNFCYGMAFFGFFWYVFFFGSLFYLFYLGVVDLFECSL